MGVRILHVDNHLLTICKPPGLLVQADRTGDCNLLTVLKEWLAEEYNKPGRVFLGLVQRLDRPVGGVMVLARTSKAAARLSEQFRNGRPEKTYLAVLKGRPVQESRRLVHYLLKDKINNQVTVCTQPEPGSQEARLHYTVLETREGHTLVKVQLETGRTHQIRAQMAAIGCPIYGDRKYGSCTELEERAEDTGSQVPVALWSYRLELEHPTRRESITFSAPPPWEQTPWSEFMRQNGED